MSNRDTIVMLVLKYLPGWVVLFDRIHGDYLAPLHCGVCDLRNRIIMCDSEYVDNASDEEVRLLALHEAGHGLAGVKHDARWRAATQRLLIAEGLGRHLKTGLYITPKKGYMWKTTAHTEFDRILHQRKKPKRLHIIKW